MIGPENPEEDQGAQVPKRERLRGRRTLDPEKPVALDLLSPEQYAAYQVAYKAHKGEPAEKHRAAWRAAVTGDGKENDQKPKK